jgi:hypothetical protein
VQKQAFQNRLENEYKVAYPTPQLYQGGRREEK